MTAHPRSSTSGLFVSKYSPADHRLGSYMHDPRLGGFGGCSIVFSLRIAFVVSRDLFALLGDPAAPS